MNKQEQTAMSFASILNTIAEAARCLGVAQEKCDKAAAEYWSAKVDQLVHTGQPTEQPEAAQENDSEWKKRAIAAEDKVQRLYKTFNEWHSLPKTEKEAVDREAANLNYSEIPNSSGQPEGERERKILHIEHNFFEMRCDYKGFRHLVRISPFEIEQYAGNQSDLAANAARRSFDEIMSMLSAAPDSTPTDSAEGAT